MNGSVANQWSIGDRITVKNPKHACPHPGRASVGASNTVYLQKVMCALECEKDNYGTNCDSCGPYCDNLTGRAGQEPLYSMFYTQVTKSTLIPQYD